MAFDARVTRPRPKMPGQCRAGGCACAGGADSFAERCVYACVRGCSVITDLRYVLWFTRWLHQTLRTVDDERLSLPPWFTTPMYQGVSVLLFVRVHDRSGRHGAHPAAHTRGCSARVECFDQVLCELLCRRKVTSWSLVCPNLAVPRLDLSVYE